MPLRFSTQIEAADWLTRPSALGNQLMPVPAGAFPAYARLGYIPDPTRPDQAESWNEMPEDHSADLAQARRALSVLAGFTDTREQCLFCVWDGFGTLPPQVAAGPVVEMPHRRHALVTGASADVADWQDLPGSSGLPPALVVCLRYTEGAPAAPERRLAALSSSSVQQRYGLLLRLASRRLDHHIHPRISPTDH